MAPTEDEFGCAEALNTVFAKAFGSPIGGGLSTYRMYDILRNDSRFEKVSQPLSGDIIMSATGHGSGKLRNGHVGLVGDNGNIMSNSSYSGKWEYNYTLDVWKRRYKDYGGFPMDFFRVKTKAEPLPFMPDTPQIQPITRNDTPANPMQNPPPPMQTKLNFMLQQLRALQQILAKLQNKLGWSRTFGVARSGGWPTFRKANIKKNCECCGRKGTFLKPLQLHHRKPFHLQPELELDPDNIITLCGDCHLLVGHLMSFHSFNTSVKEDSKSWKERIENRP